MPFALTDAPPGVADRDHGRPFSPEQPGGDRADVAEALDGHPCAAKLQANLAHRLPEDVDEPAPGGVAAAGRAADEKRLARHDTGHRTALGHRVRVHDPGHDLLVGAHVGSRDVQIRADHQHDLGGVAPGHVLELLPAHRARVAGHPALRAAIGQLHQGALPAHEHRERRHLRKRDARVVADAALGGAEDRAVMDPVAQKDLGPPVVHSRGHADDQRPSRIAQPLVNVGIERQPLGDRVQLLERGAIRFGAFEHALADPRHSRPLSSFRMPTEPEFPLLMLSRVAAMRLKTQRRGSGGELTGRRNAEGGGPGSATRRAPDTPRLYRRTGAGNGI